MSGVKNDDGKLPYDLLPFDALDEVVKVFQFGAIKYSRRNWEKGFKQHRLEAAILRHMSQHMQGEMFDKESGCLHMAHIVATGLFWLGLYLRGKLVKEKRYGNIQFERQTKVD